MRNPPGLLASKPFAGKILGMPATLSSHSLVRIGAVPVDVQNGHRASLVEAEMGRLLISVKRRTTSPGASQPVQVVNARTLTPERSAPERITARKVILL